MSTPTSQPESAPEARPGGKSAPSVTPPKPTTFTEISEIGGDLIESMPTLAQEVPGAHLENPAAPAGAPAAPPASGPAPAARPVNPKYAHLSDVDGNRFDPRLHQNNHGRPKLSKEGLLKKWVGPRRARAENQDDQVVSQLDAAADKLDEANRQQREEEEKKKKLSPEQAATASRALAKVAASMLFNFSVAVGGDEWLPQSSPAHGLDERANIEQALGDYFIATGKTDFPPGWALVIALGGYALPRFLMPKTKSRMSVAASWLKNKFTGFQLWRSRRAADKSEPKPGA